jgi:hypothetical protein
MLFQKVEILMIFGVDKRPLTWGVHWPGNSVKRGFLIIAAND